MELRLLVHPPAAGDWNMAVDDALLERVAAGGPPCLRFYRWRTATLSLGYFQAAAQREAEPLTQALPWVRRPTGGGAIVHHCELTYSLVVPHPVRADARCWYDVAHQSLTELLALWGVVAQRSPGKAGQPPPFLCFERRSEGDVVVGPAKIAGSAQRKHRGALLQHGSVLLAASPFAPQLPGLKELTKRELAADDLREAWTARWAASLDAKLAPGELQPDEIRAIDRLTRQRHNDPRWRNRR